MADVDAARRELESALGPQAVLADPLARRLYARDASMVEGGCALVALPTTTEQVQACVRAAAAHGLPIVPRGSGTGLAGAATPIGDSLVVATARMTRIVEVRPGDLLAWVEPGVPNLDLANHLRPDGFTYAPDPSSQQTSSIGGNVNTNAGGPHCLAYGVTSAHVLALDVVMADGTLERFGAEGPEAAGYDLRGVVVGSEGTLGIVTRACVRIVPLPPAVRTMLFGFDTVEACAATVSSIIAQGVVPAAVEMMDQGIVRAVESFAHAGYPVEAAAVLLVEVDGTHAGVAAQTREVEAAAEANGASSVREASDDAERALLWKGRKSAFGAIAQIAPHYHLHDCVVPRTKLVEVMRGVYAIAERHGLVVVLAPGPGEEALAREIAGVMRTPAVVLADPPTSLAELAALLAGAALHLGNDTGPRHIAVALGTPTVVLIGPTDPRHTAHQLERQRVLREDVACSPCGLKACPIDQRCMTRIGPERVTAAAAELLA
jgi:glycolate oxidase